MSGDPVEESGQALRQGFVQALQTAHTTAALIRGQGGQARSNAESEQRMRHAEAKEGRSIIEHRLRVIDAVESAGQAKELNTARVDEIRARIERSGEQHELEQRRTTRQIERADTDLKRREKAGRLERKQSRQIHEVKVEAYTNRDTRADELHKLDVEYKKLLIKIRRRAAGFSDTLTAHGETGEAMASAASFAAAKSAEGLSQQHAADSDAYAERFAEDSGHDPSGIIDATLIEELDDLDPTVNAPREPSPVAIEDVIGLTEELSIATHLTHEFADLADEADSERDVGWVIGDAVDAAGLTGVGSAPPMDFGLEAEVSTAAMPLAPDRGLEP